MMSSIWLIDSGVSGEGGCFTSDDRLVLSELKCSIPALLNPDRMCLGVRCSSADA